jgi:hypothetical protein
MAEHSVRRTALLRSPMVIPVYLIEIIVFMTCAAEAGHVVSPGRGYEIAAVPLRGFFR